MICTFLLGGLVYGGEPSETNSNLGYYTQPAIRGDKIVFVSEGDIWEVGVQGGLAHALTSHVATSSNPSISPNGTTLAFTGTYEGPQDVYLLPTEGGQTRRLTYQGGTRAAGWTPDGKVIAATRNHSTLPDVQLETIEPNGLKTALLPLAQASEGVFGSDGITIFFTRLAFQGSSTRRYQGGTAQNLWKYVPGAAEAEPLTASYNGTSKNPMAWHNRIYFLSDRDGGMNIWSMNESGKDLREVTHHNDLEVRSASLDAGRIVYQLGADLWVCDLNKGTDAKLDVRLQSDFNQTREQWVRDPFKYLSAAAIAPDGKHVVLTARGQIFVSPAESGRLVEVTRKSDVRYRNAFAAPDNKSVFALSDETGETEWWSFPADGIGAGKQITHNSKVLGIEGSLSPDGKLLAYSDKNLDLWLADVATGTPVKIETGLTGPITDLTWSPDGRFLAYTFTTDTFNQIHLYSIEDKKWVRVTSDRSDSSSPAWSPDGKWLYFLSDRNFVTTVSSPWGSRAPEPFFDHQTKIYQIGLTKGLRSPFIPNDELTTESEAKPVVGSVKVNIDFDGIQNRLWEVPVKAANYSQLKCTGSRLFVLDSGPENASEIKTVEIKNEDVAIKSVATGVTGIDLSRDGKKLLVRRDNDLFVIDAATSGPAHLEKSVPLSNWSFPIQPQEEWHQMFREAWRLERDYFYDLKMHSVDWNAVYARYSPLVDRVRNRTELSNLIAQMVSELSALHTFVYGGDTFQTQDRTEGAALGAELSRDPASGGYRVDRVYQGDPDYPLSLAPLARPEVAVEAGDVILQVNGEDALTSPDIYALLRGQRGKQVRIRVKPKSGGPVRDCIVVPISSGAESGLRYEDWEQSRRQKVEAASKGTVGYVHLRAMGSEDIAQWEKDFYPAFNRDGLIIDVRNNNGGNIDSWIIEKLLRKAWFYWQPRVGNPYWNMQQAFRGHVAVICNEGTASDGEAFTEGIKRLGIGKVIGTRTWGGEIWLTSSNNLRDGGIATAAENGVYGPEGKWLIEGHGVDPDITVDNLPHRTFLGEDAQLEAALAYLAKEIKDHPVPIPPRPAYPDKSGRPHKG